MGQVRSWAQDEVLSPHENVLAPFEKVWSGRAHGSRRIYTKYLYPLLESTCVTIHVNIYLFIWGNVLLIVFVFLDAAFIFFFSLKILMTICNTGNWKSYYDSFISDSVKTPGEVHALAFKNLGQILNTYILAFKTKCVPLKCWKFLKKDRNIKSVWQVSLRIFFRI